ncbi:murein transglycosylase [Skermanella stibiiresistens SB22]|uniref:peptidoglycan lytic exotransglycosylase n=1 Tax=Skermanella stibiiresistens SB22 TaxID=1385369 RepID=W9H309_9PROT|nr:murein transglycosylase A [Skermanella stibiiresistens]EWY40590.1 murein transglycosylase [Skermanella stibiiresistens SB22]
MTGSIRWIGTALAAVLAVFLASCAPKAPKEPEAVPPKLTLTPASFPDLPGWRDDTQADTLDAFAKSCARLVVQPADRAVGAAGKVADWQAPCRALAAVPRGDQAAARAYFETWFLPYAAADNDKPEGLFTGYYEAELRGSALVGGRYTVPLYRKPDDLVMVDLGEFRDALKGERIAGRVVDGRLRPYEDRARIEKGALKGRDLELVWVDDPVDAFFLQIQGSGRVVMEDGSVVRVGYAGQNGHPYVAIGRELIARGALTRETVSMQSIRDWLRANPGEATALMDKNPSFVFFQTLTGEGPLGAQGVALTPGRSLAVDRSFVPYGVPVWLDAQDPLDAEARLRRLMVAQDTGGAIRGVVRGDVFWGHGHEAELRAGKMKSPGRYYLLIPKGVTPVG